MGMSRDYDMAIQNGSTFVRIGSAFFKENENNFMALKTQFDKNCSYFDTDEVTDYEDAAKEELKNVQ